MNTNLKAILWAAFVMLTWSRSGGAQAVAKTCIPRAIGVPGLWQQPPNWWSNGRPRLPRFDDPRWQGATSHTDGSGDAQHVDFRALQRSDTLFLSWVVKVDPELNPHVGIIDTQAEDELWFGIEQQGGESPVVLKFVFKTTGAGEALTHSDADGYNVMVWLADMVADPTLMTLGAWQYSSNSTDPNKLPPPWITGTGAVWKLSPAGEAWGFQLALRTNGTAVGLADGPNIGTDFKMWYQVDVRLPSQTDVVHYTWPRELGTIVSYRGVGGPNLSDWGPFTRSDPLPNDCQGDLAIAAHSDIGTKNTPDSKILFSVSGTSPDNLFVVRPTNITSPSRSVAKDSVNARFWIANWGSQPGWTAGTGQWQQLTPVDELQLRQQSKNVGDIGAGLATSSSEIEFTWALSGCWLAQFRRGLDPSYPLPGACPDLVRGSHQCVLAELSSPQPYSFVRKSFWRNMDFETASVVTRDAQIGVQRLPEREGRGPKTVYLYVETHNMPEFATGSQRLGWVNLLPRAPGYGRATGSVVRQLTDSGGAAERARRAFFFVGNDGIDSVAPTYRVHVYRETPDSVVVRGRKVPGLRPQTSFGYWVQHNGNVAGWRHSIAGAHGVTLHRIAPNFYKLTVPNDSFTTVITRIEALAPKRYALSVHAGVSLPHGSLKNTVDPGFAVTADLAVRLNQTFTAEALYGRHRFNGKASSPDVDVSQMSLGLKAFLNAGRVRPFITAGGGSYRFDPGSTDPGAHAGVGVEFNASLRLAFDAEYTGHTVFSGSTKTFFSSLQGGGRVRF